MNRVEDRTEFYAQRVPVQRTTLTKGQKGGIGLIGISGAVVAGEITHALGMSGGTVGLVAAAAFLLLSTIAYYGTLKYLESKQVTRLPSETESDFSDHDNQEISQPTASRPPFSRIERTSDVEEEGEGSEERATIQKTIGMAREAEGYMSLGQQREITRSLEELNKQIKILRTKFTACTVALGFEQALAIVDAELAKDAKQNTQLLHIYGRHHGGINLRDLILKGTATIENVDNLTVQPNFTEIKQGLLPQIQQRISHFIQSRFNQSVHRDLSLALDHLEKDFKQAANISQRQLNKLTQSGISKESLELNQEAVVKNLRHIYQKDSLRLDRLVRGAMASLAEERKINHEITQDGEEAFIQKLADRLNQIFEFNDDGATIEAFKQKVFALERGKRLAPVQRRLTEEFPRHVKALESLYSSILTDYATLERKLDELLKLQARIYQLHLVSAAQNVRGSFVESETDSYAAQILVLQSDIDQLKGRIQETQRKIADTITKADQLRSFAAREGLEPPMYPTVAYEIETSKVKCQRKEKEIEQFLADSKKNRIDGKRVQQILEGSGPGLIEQAKAVAGAAVSAAFSVSGAIIGGITSRMPTLPTSGWFGGKTHTSTAAPVADSYDEDEVLKYEGALEYSDDEGESHSTAQGT